MFIKLLKESANGEWNNAEKWGYAVLANSVLVLLSIVGILSVKCSDETSRQYVTDIFLGLAVSTMLGDSILHIIPIFLGLHKHDEAGHEGWEKEIFFDFCQCD